nr:protein-L-isoaspartate O-methyltransferase [Acidobacteriota bacterium]
QLKMDGKLVIPIGETRESQRLIRFVRTEKGYAEEDHGACAFVPLIGHYGWSAQ